MTNLGFDLSNFNLNTVPRGETASAAREQLGNLAGMLGLGQRTTASPNAAIATEMASPVAAVVDDGASGLADALRTTASHAPEAAPAAPAAQAAPAWRGWGMDDLTKLIGGGARIERPVAPAAAQVATEAAPAAAASVAKTGLGDKMLAELLKLGQKAL